MADDGSATGMLAIAGGKGGSGKTTTTACLARALAASGLHPIAVDGDCDMPDLHIVAGTPSAPGVEAYVKGESITAATHSAVELPGVDVLPAGDATTESLQTALTSLSDQSRQVLVDTPAGASPAVATTLRLADAVLLVTTPTRESLEDAAKTAAMARTVGTNICGSVVTRSDETVDPSDLLDCRTLEHVPVVDAPLTDPRVANRYEGVATRVNKRNI